MYDSKLDTFNLKDIRVTCQIEMLVIDYWLPNFDSYDIM